MKLNSFAKFSWVVLVMNMVVILWGAFVRATGSGAGCGSHWPLCNGVVVPIEPRIQTVIEFIHRLTSGAAFLLVIALLIWAWRAYPPGNPIRTSVVIAFLGMIAESLVGASLVLFQWVALDISIGRIITVPIHLIITFALLASLVLTAWWASGQAVQPIQSRDKIFWMLLLGLVGVVIMSMAGALTALGDTVLPVPTLTEQAIRDLSPLGQFLVNLRVVHPVIAVGVGAYMLFLVQYLLSTQNESTTRRLTQIVGALFLLQLVAGIINIYLQAPVWMQMFHLLFANLVWMALVLLAATHAAQEIP